MRGPLSIVAGLVVGVAAAGLLLAGLVALTPDDPSPPGPTPPVVLASPTPTPTPSASASPTPTPSASSSSSPIASAGASAAANDAAFHVGQPAPALPGVDVTP